MVIESNIENSSKIPICSMCKKLMLPNKTDQIGYLMWKCKECGHKTFKILPGIKVIHNKEKQSNKAIHRTAE